MQRRRCDHPAPSPSTAAPTTPITNSSAGVMPKSTMPRKTHCCDALPTMTMRWMHKACRRHCVGDPAAGPCASVSCWYIPRLGLREELLRQEKCIQWCWSALTSQYLMHTLPWWQIWVWLHVLRRTKLVYAIYPPSSCTPRQRGTMTSEHWQSASQLPPIAF